MLDRILELVKPNWETPGFYKTQISLQNFKSIVHPLRQVTASLISEYGATIDFVEIDVPFHVRGPYSYAYAVRCKCGVDLGVQRFKIQKRKSKFTLTPSPLCPSCASQHNSDFLRDKRLSLTSSNWSLFETFLHSKGVQLLEPYRGESFHDTPIFYKTQCACGNTELRRADHLKRYPLCKVCNLKARAQACREAKFFSSKTRDYSIVFTQFSQYFVSASPTTPIENSTRFRRKIRNLLLFWKYLQERFWNKTCIIYGLKASKNNPVAIHHIDSISNDPSRAVSLDNGVALSATLHRELHSRYGTSTTAEHFAEFYLEKTGQPFRLEEHLPSHLYQEKSLLDYFPKEILNDASALKKNHSPFRYN